MRAPNNRIKSDSASQPFFLQKTKAQKSVQLATQLMRALGILNGKTMGKLKQEDVLVYRKGRRSQSTVKRHYIAWREQQVPPTPIRCDNSECVFYTKSLLWNGKELKLILDHIYGVHGDNRPKNLQLLCPNCNSQQTTQGGGNKGKNIQSEGGFTEIREDGKKDYTLPAESDKYIIKIGDN